MLLWLVVFQRFGQILLNGQNAMLIRGVIGEEFSGFTATTGSHALPKGHRHRGVVASHGSKDKSHVVGFALVVTGEFAQHAIGAESENFVAQRLPRAIGGCAQDSTKRCCTILCFHALRHLLGTMPRHSVGYLVSQNDG